LLRCFPEKEVASALARKTLIPVVAICEAVMDPEAIRVLIQAKIQDGRLPRRSITRVFSIPSTGEKCDACETIVSMDQLVVEGTALAPGKRAFKFHIRCFEIWDHERYPA
jgi:hypothetical protein